MLLRCHDPECSKNRIDRVGYVNMKALLLVKETFFKAEIQEGKHL